MSLPQFPKTSCVEFRKKKIIMPFTGSFRFIYICFERISKRVLKALILKCVMKHVSQTH